jgi:hypothetical protein
MGGPPAWGLGEGLTTPRRKITSSLRNATEGLGTLRILWNGLGNGKWI